MNDDNGGDDSDDDDYDGIDDNDDDIHILIIRPNRLFVDVNCSNNYLISNLQV